MSDYYARAARTGDGGVQKPRRRPRPAAPSAPAAVHDPDGERLQKVLARAGVGSRRQCETLITAGRVQVDGQVVRELGVRVRPGAKIHVDGMPVQTDMGKLTMAFNKPTGVVSTMSDPQGRICLGEWFEDHKERLFHVGRLDTDTEGLILVTNDGELAHRLAHPSYEIRKTYIATVEGTVKPGLVKRLESGVELEDGLVVCDRATVKASTPYGSIVEVVLHEGRNRIVRRLLAECGHPVTRLVRTRVGPITLGDLRPGRHRVISGPELSSLMKAVDL
ncbi:pseudouridine synthase [Buchananella hordeovulneris]|uniref:pseudouridine synthase n=1 Tax=Buchananella hordeovulneris TaxID=52770 RepID=UPI0026DB209B|nr:pseudouridine synthase [Buchananella hordeovulneris]MDO5079730.1 pseudouridine synthase [Buchananella hordeovulneris]